MDSERLDQLGEEALVARLTARLPLGPRVVAGPGDDCALVRVPGRAECQLLKTDCLLEDVHFRREHPAPQVGWKALARVISDIAAAGGKPDAALVTVAAPADLPVAYLDGLYRGLTRAARRFGVSIVGGETAHSPAGLFVSVAMTGWVKTARYVGRGGGRVGDVLLVTGRLGGSFGADGRGRHLSFVPRLVEARWLTKHFRVHAMMDLSDGLAADLPRLAQASRRGYQVDLGNVPRQRGCSLEQAVGDGEDYELLLAVAANDAEKLLRRWREQFPRVPLTVIGTLRANPRDRTPLPGGYRHFATEKNSVT